MTNPNAISDSPVDCDPNSGSSSGTVAVHVEPIPTAGVPKTLGPYQLGRELGRGAMGAVYEATHTKLKRRVAIKLLPAVHGHLPQRVNRFTAEMEAIGRLDHPHVVRAFDAGEVDGLHYLVMEFVEGIDIEKLIMLGEIPYPAAADIIRQTAMGLQHIHEHHLVHRDIKPSNLILSNLGLVKILDLGIAKLRDESNQMTAIGGLIGTPDYLAPEQAQRSNCIDIRADIYSLGCTFYTLLAGIPPFSGPDFDQPVDKLLAHCCEYPEPLTDFNSEIPEALVKIIDKMMEKRPEDRYQTPQEVVEALAPFVLSQGKETQDLVQLARVGRALEGMPQIRRRTTTESLVSKSLRARNRRASQTSLSAWLGWIAAAGALWILWITWQSSRSEVVTVVPDAQGGVSPLTVPSDGRQLVEHAEAIRSHAAKTASSSQHLDETTSRIADSLESLQANLPYHSGAGLVESPANAGEAFHNARIYQRQGNNLRAKENFLLALQWEPKYVDLYQEFASFLTLHEGATAARRTLSGLAELADEPLREYAKSLVLDEAERRTTLTSLVEKYPQFAPACLELARSYSSEIDHQPTFADMQHERRWIDRYRKLDREGQVLKYLLDHSQATEWSRWVDQRIASLDRIRPEVLDNPVKVHLQRASQQWQLTIQVAEEATEILYRLVPHEWESTGFSSHTSPRSGKVSPLHSVPLSDLGPELPIEVRYLDLDGVERGPFAFSLNPHAEESSHALRAVQRVRTQWVRFGEGEFDTKLYFSTLRNYRSVVAKVRYGIDVDQPDRDHDLEQVAVDVPATARSVVLEVTFVDGSKSPLVLVRRP